MTDRYRQVATHALAAGLLMSVFGWFFASTGISKSEFYNTMVDVFYWMLRIGGGLMMIVGVCCIVQLRGALLADAMVAGLCGLVMLLYSASGLLSGVGIHLNHIVVLVLGLMFLGSARQSMVLFAAEGASIVARPGVDRAAAPPVESIHPASVHPRSLPTELEPPPPDGYLAALSKEKDEPPTASYE